MFKVLGVQILADMNAFKTAYISFQSQTILVCLHVFKSIHVSLHVPGH